MEIGFINERSKTIQDIIELEYNFKYNLMLLQVKTSEIDR